MAARSLVARANDLYPTESAGWVFIRKWVPSRNASQLSTKSVLLEGERIAASSPAPRRTEDQARSPLVLPVLPGVPRELFDEFKLGERNAETLLERNA